MDQAFFFGYGSLVNCDTHGFAPVYRARAQGWRRAWRATSARRLAFLTAIPDLDSRIEGLMAPVPDGDWAALDEREYAYDRHDAVHQIDHEAPLQAGAGRIAIYAIAPERMTAPTPEHPILLSYLDVVIQGYLRHFGEEGVARFIETTDGWEAPVLNDRAAPQYPRAQRLSSRETGLVDTILREQNSILLTV